LPISQPPDNKDVTGADKPSGESQKENLAPSLFFDSEIDPDLRLIVELWPNLPEHIKSSIKALAELTGKPKSN
jgi:hypothetical protein